LACGVCGAGAASAGGPVTEYLTAADVAETLGVSARTVLRWIEAGDLAAVRLPGGRMRVSQAALAEHLAAWSTVEQQPAELSLTPNTDIVGVTPT
jgi:excisionase family DNA binding protein